MVVMTAFLVTWMLDNQQDLFSTPPLRANVEASTVTD
jgi:hypothetical protein